MQNLEQIATLQGFIISIVNKKVVDLSIAIWNFEPGIAIRDMQNVSRFVPFNTANRNCSNSNLAVYIIRLKNKKFIDLGKICIWHGSMPCAEQMSISSWR